MLMLALALATMPQPIEPTLPGELGGYGTFIADTRPAATQLDLTVDPTGAPVRCDVVVSDGNRRLDRFACDLLLRKARFLPARDATGRPVAAVVREDFTVNRADGAPRRVDFALEVARLPRALPVMVADAVVTTDASGAVAACEVAGSTRDAALDRLACRQLTATAFPPARDRDGRPVGALRKVSVAFTAAPVPR